jgi:hypothetical protein
MAMHFVFRIRIRIFSSFRDGTEPQSNSGEFRGFYYASDYGGQSPDNKIQRISTSLQSVAADLTESHPFGVAAPIRHVLPHNDMELLLQLRNFVRKLCARLEKYQKRGIVVEDDHTRVDFLFVVFP